MKKTIVVNGQRMTAHLVPGTEANPVWAVGESARLTERRAREWQQLKRSVQEDMYLYADISVTKQGRVMARKRGEDVPRRGVVHKSWNLDGRAER